MALVTVLLQQGFGLGQPHAVELFCQELFAPEMQLGHVVISQYLQGKAQVGHDVEAAILVIHVKLVVGFLVELLVNNAFLYQPVSPQVVGIAADQGVVQVENRERHGLSLREGAILCEADDKSYRWIHHVPGLFWCVCCTVVH